MLFRPAFGEHQPIESPGIAGGEPRHGQQGEHLDQIFVDDQIVALSGQPKIHAHERRIGDIIERQQQDAEDARQTREQSQQQRQAEKRQPPHVQQIDAFQQRRIGGDGVKNVGQQPARVLQKRRRCPCAHEDFRQTFVEKMPADEDAQKHDEEQIARIIIRNAGFLSFHFEMSFQTKRSDFTAGDMDSGELL